MNIKRLCPVFFSPCNQTKDLVLRFADILAKELSCGSDIEINGDVSAARRIPITVTDFTLPPEREKVSSAGGWHFEPDDLVIFGTPTYAGRVPNKVLPFVQELFHAGSSPAVTLVTFGNRNFDSSLTELTNELCNNGFKVFAAGGFACEHVFSNKLAPGRPDADDMKELEGFAKKCARKLKDACENSPSLSTLSGNGAHESTANVKDKAFINLTPPVIRDGAEVAPYYTPLGIDGEPAKFLKAKPLTDMSKCTQCGECVSSCPFGSINPEDVSDVPGVCVKCQACVKSCPTGAKYFDDAAFLSHVAYLEAHYADRRTANEVYL